MNNLIYYILPVVAVVVVAVVGSSAEAEAKRADKSWAKEMVKSLEGK